MERKVFEDEPERVCEMCRVLTWEEAPTHTIQLDWTTLATVTPPAQTTEENCLSTPPQQKLIHIWVFLKSKTNNQTNKPQFDTCCLLEMSLNESSHSPQNNILKSLF